MSEERKFKVGDRVRVLEEWWDKNLVGKVGTVLESHDSGMKVQFDDFIDGHTCEGLGENGHCWNLLWDMGDKVELLKERWKVLIMPEGDTTTARLYENGLVTKSVSTKKHPDDEYSMEVACEVLMDRLFPKTEIVKQSRYNVGDKVKIIDKWVHGCYENVMGRMDKYLGTVMTIRSVDSDGDYRMEEDKDENYHSGWAWTPVSIEGKVVDKRKVESKPEEPNIEGFKVGDVVELVDNSSHPRIPTGVRGVVYVLDKDGLIGVDLKMRYPYDTCTLLNGAKFKPLSEETGIWVFPKRIKKVS